MSSLSILSTCRTRSCYVHSETTFRIKASIPFGFLPLLHQLPLTARKSLLCREGLCRARLHLSVEGRFIYMLWLLRSESCYTWNHKFTALRVIHISTRQRNGKRPMTLPHLTVLTSRCWTLVNSTHNIDTWRRSEKKKVALYRVEINWKSPRHRVPWVAKRNSFCVSLFLIVYEFSKSVKRLGIPIRRRNTYTQKYLSKVIFLTLNKAHTSPRDMSQASWIERCTHRIHKAYLL